MKRKYAQDGVVFEVNLMKESKEVRVEIISNDGKPVTKGVWLITNDA